jgi:PAS domain S-box-containing protein
MNPDMTYPQLEAKLAEAEQILEAIRSGQADAVLSNKDILLLRLRNVEQALRESEQRYRNFVERNPDAIFSLDMAGKFVEVNHAAVRLTGYNSDELLERHWQDLCDPEDFERAAGALETARAGRTFDLPCSIICKDGRVVALGLSGGPLMIGDQIQGVFVFVHDLTELKTTEADLRRRQDELQLQNLQLRQAQAQIEESRRKYTDLFDFAPTGYVVIDPQGHVLDVNMTGASMLQIEKDQLIDRPFETCIGEDDRDKFYRFRQQVGEIEACLRFDLKLLRNGREAFQAELLLHPVTDSEGEIIHCRIAFVDITARKNAEEMLYRWNETLEQRVTERTEEVQRQADRLRALASQLSQTEQRERKRLARILHDHIQQLIVAARMQMGWMKRGIDEQRAETLKAADAILFEALEASRSLAVDLSPPILHEEGLCGGLKWLVLRMQEMNRFTVHLEADSNAEPDSEDTQLLLFECVRELLLNTLKHAGVSEAEVTLLRPQDDSIELTVSDHGKGFDPEMLGKLETNEVSFGLFSIQERLEHIGGLVDIETSPGRGTRIIMRVPAARQQPLPELTETRQPKKRSAIKIHRKIGICRVLVCDDHKIVREGLVRMLQLEPDMEVVGEAADGLEAMQLAAKLKPDVIVMDIHMEQMSGVEATKRILAAYPDIKVIGLSMHTDKYAAKAMQYAGAVAYLTKSGPAEDLITAVRAYSPVSQDESPAV